MPTRITSMTLGRNVLADINAANARMIKAQEQLSSGKILTKPSDDPAAVGRALQYRKDIEATQQFQRNASEADGWTDVTDSALSSIGEALLRVRDLTVQAASDSTGPDGRKAIAEELKGLIDTVKIAANASYGGRYVFSGSMTDTRPFNLGTDDGFYGDDQSVARQIGPGVTVQVNVDGERLLIGDGVEPGLLATMRTVLAQVQGNDVQGLSTSLGALDKRQDSLNAVRATIGATANRIEVANARLAEYEGTALELLNLTESADLAKTMVEYSQYQAAMQAGLKAGASIVQSSLLDFLR
jgi:flagellar hook-associated protein 3 FlgL